MEIARGLKEMGLSWSTEGGHCNIVSKFSDKELGELYKTGCKLIIFGVDSGSEKILRLSNRNIDLKKVVELNKRMSKLNIKLRYNFMCGFPEETFMDLKKTISLVFQLKRDNPYCIISPINVLLLSPNTSFYKKAIDEGYRSLKTLEEWGKISVGYIGLPWISKERRKLLRNIYLNSYFLNDDYHIDLLPIFRIITMFFHPFAIFYFKKKFKIS